MNSKAEDAADKIMLAFDSGGLLPLDLHQYGRAMETPGEKKQRKREGFQRAMKERQGVAQ